MPITSETFYRAECDHDGCKTVLPNDEDESGSHWPRKSVIEALAEERGADDETWTVVGDLTYCPRHKPGNAECSACDGRGYFRAERDPATLAPGQGKWALTDCPVCERRGYLIAATPPTREEKP